jgi:hypothetical protein
VRGSGEYHVATGCKDVYFEFHSQKQGNSYSNAPEAGPARTRLGGRAALVREGSELLLERRRLEKTE